MKINYTYTMRYSVIIPVYNRPDEVDELLQSLTAQHFKDFEVVVVEDGSSVPCEKIVNRYQGFFRKGKPLSLAFARPLPGAIYNNFIATASLVRSCAVLAVSGSSIM